MHDEWISVDAEGGGTCGAYLALPPAGRGPGLLLFQEIFGVNRHIRAVAQQYALDGFVVLAPDLFWRETPRVELGYEGADRERAMALMKAARPEQLAADIRSSLTALRARPQCTGRVGAFGYCMGGRLAYVAAATTDIDAATCFYGGGIHDQLDLAGDVRCPIQFHYGAKDAHIPLPAVEKVKAAFAGRSAEIHVYDAEHGFNCWERASYHAPSAALAHARALELFARTLF
ncbi:dienelactone hydrolase family protein [uncultured Piscinibacter sp.]|uniref:dienelactone hydrolase family protein n=1 Tax=uncultured Piscinibacter sp. TaxID=1131835 RepID=UPI00261E6C51|nr:dienelactone hydrolase family protein [uncultured Piscinibacter sp.]